VLNPPNAEKKKTSRAPGGDETLQSTSKEGIQKQKPSVGKKGELSITTKDNPAK